MKLNIFKQHQEMVAKLKTEMTKRIEWSYATSPNADRFGFRNGCWTVETVRGHNPSIAIAGFTTIEEAEAYAAKMPIEWNRLTRRAKTLQAG